MKKSLLTLLAVVGLAGLLCLSCSRGGIDVKKDYFVVKVGETTNLYGKEFVPTAIVGDSALNYYNPVSQQQRGLFKDIAYNVFFPDSSVVIKLIKANKNFAEIEAYERAKEATSLSDF
jgi:hypothetical protein